MTKWKFCWWVIGGASVIMVYGRILNGLYPIYSMGGAVVVDAANRNWIPNCVGVAVVDVVEGMDLVIPTESDCN
jgi:hypothetical protein